MLKKVEEKLKKSHHQARHKRSALQRPEGLQAVTMVPILIE